MANATGSIDTHDTKGGRTTWRIAIAVVLVAVLACLGYLLSPFLAAGQIHNAVRTGDIATLEYRVDWPSVRASLKRSSGEARRVLEEISEVTGVEQPGLWQRLTSRIVPFLADPLIDRYVTADGAPRLHAWRETWKQKVRPTLGLSEPETALAGTWLAGTTLDRLWTVWRRVDSVAFESPRRIRIVVRDRFVETRRWRAVMTLDGFTWKLTDLDVLRVWSVDGGGLLQPDTALQ